MSDKEILKEILKEIRVGNWFRKFLKG